MTSYLLTGGGNNINDRTYATAAKHFSALFPPTTNPNPTLPGSENRPRLANYFIDRGKGKDQFSFKHRIGRFCGGGGPVGPDLAS